MDQAMGTVISLGIAVALNPISIIAVVLLLASPKGRLNGLAFLAGWALGLAVTGTIVLLIADDNDAGGGSATAGWVGILEIVLGLLLLLLAAQQWTGRPRGDEEPELPAWMKKLNTFTPLHAVSTAFLLAVGNPKSLVLVAGASVSIAQAGVNSAQQAAALTVFVLIGALGPGTPVAIHVLRRDRAAIVLESLHGWMARHNKVIIALICLIIGLALVSSGVDSRLT